MTKLREFTKDDWRGFSGAIEKHGKPPMVREERCWVGVCDNNGIEIQIGDSTNMDNLYIWPESSWTIYAENFGYGIAKFVLENLPEEVNVQLLEELGFKEV